MEHKYLVYGGIFLLALIAVGGVVVYFGTPGGDMVGKFTAVGDEPQPGVVTGKSHYCFDIENIRVGNVMTVAYKETSSERYGRIAVVGIDCPEADGKNWYTRSGFKTCAGGGRYYFLGKPRAGGRTYTYDFTFTQQIVNDLNLNTGRHKICTWPSSGNYVWNVEVTGFKPLDGESVWACMDDRPGNEGKRCPNSYWQENEWGSLSECNVARDGWDRVWPDGTKNHRCPNYRCSCTLIEEEESVQCGATLTEDTTLDRNLEFTDNQGVCLTIGASDITLDCNGHSIFNTGNGDTGILLRNVQNVKVKNCQVKDFQYCIELANADSSELRYNYLTNCAMYGIGLHTGSDSNILYNNTIWRGASSGDGIHFCDADNNEVNNNTAINNNAMDFRCEENTCAQSTGTFTNNNVQNRFTKVTACADGWPVLNTDYTN